MGQGTLSRPGAIAPLLWLRVSVPDSRATPWSRTRLKWPSATEAHCWSGRPHLAGPSQSPLAGPVCEVWAVPEPR